MKWIVVGLLIAVYLFEMIVALLNHRYRTKPIPDNLKDVYDEEGYQKWLAYSLDTHRFNLIKRGFNLVVMVAFLLFGVFARLEEVTNTWTSTVTRSSTTTTTTAFIKMATARTTASTK